MGGPPRIRLPRGSIHAPLDQSKERSLRSTRAITLPNMRTVAIHLVVESMIHRHLVATVVIHRVGEEQEPSAMPGPILTPRVAPARRDEKVAVDGLVQERIDHVAAGSELQQRLG